MPIVIGGPPSSGSSVLSVVLNRHSDIHCIQESHLLAKDQLYTASWRTVQKSLRNRRSASPGWHRYAKIDMDPEDYRLLLGSLETSHDFTELINQYFDQISSRENKNIWVEKTPANVYFFGRLQHMIPKLTCVLTVRNPYDIIASLIKRGKPVLDAVALCLVNLGLGYIQGKQEVLMQFRYEDFVGDTQSYTEVICDKLNIPFEPTMLKASQKPDATMPGWKHFEDGKISNTSINRFSELTADKRAEVIHLARCLYLNPSHISQFLSEPVLEEQLNIRFLADYFGYQNYNEVSKVKSFSSRLILEKIKRRLLNHPSARAFPVIYLHS